MFFCLGNICRSPIAEGLFRAKVEERQLENAFHIESSGTSGYHEGELPDPGSIRVIEDRANVDISYQRSQPLLKKHLNNFEYIVGMDISNLSNARAIFGESISEEKLFRLRDYDPQGSGDVPDPWGDGGAMFNTVFDMVDRSLNAFLTHLIEKHGLD